MSISAWWLLAIAVPVLLLGERMVRHLWIFSRFNIPVPVAGGLTVALAVLAVNLSGQPLKIVDEVSAMAWTWIATPEIEWVNAPSKKVYLPLMIAFFTCVGLNASWQVVKTDVVKILLFLGLATALAVIQSGLGIALAKAIGTNPILGLICGSVTMTGGHGTALGLADRFEAAGFAGAKVVGAAAATFGLVCGGLLGGPVGGRLIRKYKLKSSELAEHGIKDSAPPQSAGFLGDIHRLLTIGPAILTHLIILLICIKIGAWLSLGIQKIGLIFPAQIGAMILGIIVRNTLDALGRPLVRTPIVDLLASICLGLFLSMAMSSLNLIELAGVAGPMLVILVIQVTVMAAFATFITFRIMGRNFDAAIMAGGHCGFGLGATPNAVANMESLTDTYGPSTRAFLVVTTVGAFLIDITNNAAITAYLSMIQSLWP